jgi:hypothetical protein
MKMVMLYHPVSGHARLVEGYARDFERIHHLKPELASLETPEGANIAKVYDVVQYPAIIVTQDDGAHMKQWEGEKLPLMDEVAAQLRQ